MLDKIVNQVDENEIVKTLQEFIQIPSCNPPGEETECAKYAAKKMKEWGCDSEVIFKCISKYGTMRSFCTYSELLKLKSRIGRGDSRT